MRVANSLLQLRNEFNARWPNRDKSSDGTIGDIAHQHQPSDHNPNAQGVICAMDVDTDLDGTNDNNDPEMDAIVEWIRLHPHPDLKYVIYRHRMFSRYVRPPYPPFTWRPYTGDSHVSHPHFSVGVGRDGQSVQPYDDMDMWLPPLSAPIPPLQKDENMLILIFNNGKYILIGNKITPLEKEPVAAVPIPYLECSPRQWKFFTDNYGQPER